MGFCKDCRWWEAVGANNPQPGMCSLVEADNGIPSLAVVSMYDNDLGDLESGLLFTAPNFGCVQFSAREPA